MRLKVLLVLIAMLCIVGAAYAPTVGTALGLSMAGLIAAILAAIISDRHK